MVGRYFSIMISALIVYAIMAWPMFVLGIYCGHLRSVAKQSAKRHLVTSWLLVITGCIILFGGFFMEKHLPGTDSANGLIVIIMLGAATALSALPAGAAYAKLEKKQWHALFPPVTGIVSQAFFFGTIWVAQHRRW